MELWDLDKRSADDLMCTVWFHTDFLPADFNDSEHPALVLDRAEVDGPHLTAHVQNCKRFDADFRCAPGPVSCLHATLEYLSGYALLTCGVFGSTDWSSFSPRISETASGLKCSVG